MCVCLVVVKVCTLARIILFSWLGSVGRLRQLFRNTRNVSMLFRQVWTERLDCFWAVCLVLSYWVSVLVTVGVSVSGRGVATLIVSLVVLVGMFG